MLYVHCKVCSRAALPDLCDFASLLMLWTMLIVVGSEQCHLRSASQWKVYLLYRLLYSLCVLLYCPFDETKEQTVKGKVFLLQWNWVCIICVHGSTHSFTYTNTSTLKWKCADVGCRKTPSSGHSCHMSKTNTNTRDQSVIQEAACLWQSSCPGMFFTHAFRRHL